MESRVNKQTAPVWSFTERIDSPKRFRGRERGGGLTRILSQGGEERKTRAVDFFGWGLLAGIAA